MAKHGLCVVQSNCVWSKQFNSNTVNINKSKFSQSFIVRCPRAPHKHVQFVCKGSFFAFNFPVARERDPQVKFYFSLNRRPSLRWLSAEQTSRELHFSKYVKLAPQHLWDKFGKCLKQWNTQMWRCASDYLSFFAPNCSMRNVACTLLHKFAFANYWHLLCTQLNQASYGEAIVFSCVSW